MGVSSHGSELIIVTPGGTAVPVPRGATGPTDPQKGSGMAYWGGSGGFQFNPARTFDPRTTAVRIMDATSHHPARAVYMNERGQSVDPWTGRTVEPHMPEAHFLLK